MVEKIKQFYYFKGFGTFQLIPVIITVDIIYIILMAGYAGATWFHRPGVVYKIFVALILAITLFFSLRRKGIAPMNNYSDLRKFLDIFLTVIVLLAVIFINYIFF